MEPGESQRGFPRSPIRAVGIVQEHRGEYPSLQAAIEPMASKDRLTDYRRPIGYIPPAEAEENYCRQLASQATVTA